MRVQTNSGSQSDINAQTIKSRLSGSDEKNDQAAQVLMDVYEKADDGKTAVETFLLRAPASAQIRSQVIVRVYEAVNKDPNKFKPFLVKNGFAVFNRYEDG